MIYTNTTVRRQDRLLTEEEAMELIRTGEYGVLSLLSEDEPYGIPLNYAWDGEAGIYFHCAPEGKKLRLAHQCNRASFCIVGNTQVISDKFTTQYQSVVIRGSVTTGLDVAQRMRALELILDKYSPADKEVGMKYAERSFSRTEIVKLTIEEYSGKTKR